MAQSSTTAAPPVLLDRVAIVTGASRGIGREIALHLASLGAKVVINYVSNSAQADSVAAQINAGCSTVQAVTFQADISNPQQVKLLFDATETAFGSTLHILVNSAAILDSKYPTLADTTVQDFDQIFNVNARGAFLCCREAANRCVCVAIILLFMNIAMIVVYFGKKRIKRGGGGRIICLTTSLVASLKPNDLAYTASKAAVEAMVKILAKELKGTGITVNAVAPGGVATEMFYTGLTEEDVKLVVDECPMGRLGRTDDVAPVVGFLASDSCGWVNGQVIRVNGGTV